MTENQFKAMYVAAFLGAHAANETQEALPGWQKHIVQHPPVDDAVFQAEEVWKRLRDIKPEVLEW